MIALFPNFLSRFLQTTFFVPPPCLEASPRRRHARVRLRRTRRASFHCEELEPRVTPSVSVVDHEYMMASDQILNVSAANGVLGGAATDDYGDIEAQLYAAPVNGAVSLNLDGSFGYGCNTGYAGAVTFQFVGVVGGMFGNDTSAPATVTINEISLPNPGSQSSYDGAAVGLPLTASDSASNSVSYSATNLPPGLSIDPTTGVITGTVTADADGASPYAVNVTATDAATRVSASASFSWVVVADPGPSQPTNASGPNSGNVAEGAAPGTTVGIQVTSTDPSGAAVRLSLANDFGGRFRISNANDNTWGLITVGNTPPDYESSGGAYTLTVVATSTAGTSSRDFTVTVTNLAPSDPGNSDQTGVGVDEYAGAGTRVGITAHSSDPGGSSTVRYSLTDDADGTRETSQAGMPRDDFVVLGLNQFATFSDEQAGLACDFADVAPTSRTADVAAGAILACMLNGSGAPPEMRRRAAARQHSDGVNVMN